MNTGPYGAFGPVVVRRRLGATLRRLREDANLRLEQVAAELEVSTSKISRLETGHSVPKTWDVRNLLSVYGLEDADRRSEILRWVEESKAVAWWHPYSEASPSDIEYYLSLESEAASISHFCTTIPGLLQTSAYARAVLAEMSGDSQALTGSELDGLVAIRIGRQAALTRPENPLAFTVVLDEGALLRSVGRPEVMREQLEALVDLADLVDLRIRPFSAPTRRFSLSPFTIFFPRLTSVDLTVVNVEASGRDYYLEEASDVVEFQAAFGVLVNDSLSREQSVSRIRHHLTNPQSEGGR
jgi:transcriptional regulator with XRE-family HTH domain